MQDKTNEVNGLISDKFSAFYTVKDFLFDFWNTVQNSESVEPNFYITLPEFCGGQTVNCLDLSFYNNYRNYIHGLIAGICYFVYIKRFIKRIPSIIHN